MQGKCYNKGTETKIMYGHRWELCGTGITKSDALDRKRRIESRGKIARIQRVSDMPHVHVWLVWWRNK